MIDRETLTRIRVLRIQRCSDPMMWYRNMVGQFAPYIGWDAIDGYKSREPTGYINFIRPSDAEPTEVLVKDEQLAQWPFNCTQVHRRIIQLSRIGTPAAEKPSAQSAHAYTPSKTDQQTARGSSYEATANTVVGFFVSLCITAAIFPDLALTHNVGITSIFAVASWLRSYLIRRTFNRYQAQP